MSSDLVPPQQWDFVRPKLGVMLLWVCKQLKVKPFPKDVLKLILSFAKSGLLWEEAASHREKLMKERKFFINQKNQQMEREFSLCEH